MESGDPFASGGTELSAANAGGSRSGDRGLARRPLLTRARKIFLFVYLGIEAFAGLIVLFAARVGSRPREPLFDTLEIAWGFMLWVAVPGAIVALAAAAMINPRRYKFARSVLAIAGALSIIFMFLSTLVITVLLYLGRGEDSVH